MKKTTDKRMDKLEKELPNEIIYGIMKQTIIDHELVDEVIDKAQGLLFKYYKASQAGITKIQKSKK